MKNLYHLLNLPKDTDVKNIQQAHVHLNQASHQSQSIKPNPKEKESTPLQHASNQKPAQAIPDEHNYLMFINTPPTQASRIHRHTIKKSHYLFSAIIGGAFGLHHFLAGNRTEAITHLMLSLTLIGLPFMILKTIADIYYAAKQIPDKQGMIHF